MSEANNAEFLALRELVRQMAQLLSWQDEVFPAWVIHDLRAIETAVTQQQANEDAP